MQKTIVECDYCKKDITTSGERPGFRVVVASQPTQSGPVVQLVHVIPNPAFDEPFHFCGLKCCAKYLNSHGWV